jgi:hypothetical protein
MDFVDKGKGPFYGSYRNKACDFKKICDNDERRMDMKRFLLIALVCSLFLSACGAGQLVGPTITNIPTNTSAPTATLTTTATVVSAVPEKGLFQVITLPNTEDGTKTDVFIKNITTGEEKFFITLENINMSYHNSEYHNGNLYIIIRIGDYNNPDAEWSDELWRYDIQGNGKKLFSKKGLDFRVSPSETNIAINYLDGQEYFLVFLNNNGDEIRKFKVDYPFENTTYSSSPEKWSDDSKVYWGALIIGPVPHLFYKISIVDWKMDMYDVSQLNIGNEYDLNANTARLVYSDYPVMFDTTSAQDYANSGQKVTLFLYDLNSHVKQIVATSITKAFKPNWLDDKTIEFDDPKGDERVKYILP